MSESSSQTKKEIKPVSLKFKTQADRDKLFALAAVKGKKAATLAREIVLEYLAAHDAEVANGLIAVADYQQKLAEIRQASTSAELETNT